MTSSSPQASERRELTNLSQSFTKVYTNLFFLSSISIVNIIGLVVPLYCNDDICHHHSCHNQCYCQKRVDENSRNDGVSGKRISSQCFYPSKSNSSKHIKLTKEHKDDNNHCKNTLDDR